jgi:hypothetical protein
MTKEKWQTPAGEALEDAIQLDLEERNSYPERASFVNADRLTGEDIKEAVEGDMSVVLVFADGSAYVLTPEPISRDDRVVAPPAADQAAAGAGSPAGAK